MSVLLSQEEAPRLAPVAMEGRWQRFMVNVVEGFVEIRCSNVESGVCSVMTDTCLPSVG